jgi:Tol biopolymer transport system component
MRRRLHSFASETSVDAGWCIGHPIGDVRFVPPVLWQDFSSSAATWGALVMALTAGVAFAQPSPTAAPTPARQFLTMPRGAMDSRPTFSPDGKTVLFGRSTDHGKTWKLFVVPVSGGDARELTRIPLPVTMSRGNWSKRGDLIAFTGTSRDGKNRVWVIKADGTEPRELALSQLSHQVYYPRWYPDGNKLAVVDFADNSLKEIDIRREDVTRITNPEQVLAGMPAVCPDGKWIAFAGQKNDGQKYDQEKNSIWLAALFLGRIAAALLLIAMQRSL